MQGTQGTIHLDDYFWPASYFDAVLCNKTLVMFSYSVGALTDIMIDARSYFKMSTCCMTGCFSGCFVIVIMYTQELSLHRERVGNS